MKIVDLTSLKPSHVADLISFYQALPYEDIEIVARELAPVDNFFGIAATKEFARVTSKLSVESVFFGKDRTHIIFTDKDDDSEAFYFFSYAVDGNCEDRIIFKLIA